MTLVSFLQSLRGDFSLQFQGNSLFPTVPASHAIAWATADGASSLPRQLFYSEVHGEGVNSPNPPSASAGTCEQKPRNNSSGSGYLYPLTHLTGAGVRLEAPTFITDPPELRRARRAAAEARMKYRKALDQKKAFTSLHRDWCRLEMKAYLIGGQCG